MKISIIDKNEMIQKNLVNLIQTKKTSYWKKIAEQTSLKLFHEMSERVPAYKNFLKKSKIRPVLVRTLEDLSKVPIITKDNYLRAYPHNELMWDGNIAQPFTIHSTSGTTGAPSYFYRNLTSDFKRKLVIDNFFNYSRTTIEGPTLLIVCLGMGVWSAGVGVYTGAYLTTNIERYPVSIITPGVNKIEILKILKTIAPHFKQVIISAYPPLAKDVIDEAVEEGINLKKLNLRFIFTGEAFSEEFRNYLAKKAHVRDVLIDTMNIYGTSELGPTAVETPLTILIRRLLDTKAFASLFGDIKKVPTLAQYVPHLMNFDCVDGELYFSGNDAIPLMRYQSGDHGGVLSFENAREILAESGISLSKEISKSGISKVVSELPFVYVYERKNLVTTLYGALIYPEYLRAPLLGPDLHSYLTGKFTMSQKYDDNQNQYIEVNIELRRNVNQSKEIEDLTKEKIVDALKERSSEFFELSKNLGERVYPKLQFWTYEHPEYFAPGSKQQWIKKT